VHRHLSAIPVLQLQFLVLVTACGDTIIGPIESIRHVVVALGHAWPVANSIGDDGAIWLNEIDLSKDEALVVGQEQAVIVV